MDSKKSEYEKVKILDTLSLKFTPAWFDFVEKLLILGALKYLKDHENNWVVTIVYFLSLAIFYFYLQSILFNFPFDRFLPETMIKNDRFASIFSLIVAAILFLTLNLELNYIIAGFGIK